MVKKKKIKKSSQKTNKVKLKKKIIKEKKKKEVKKPSINLVAPEKEIRTTKEPSYEAKDIYVLEGLDPVRKRPGMYIGSTGPEGLHHLIWEVVDNSLDEAMAGYCTHIGVTRLSNNKIAVSDNGRGIPVDKHPQTKKSALETVLTTLHAGGKFGGESYKIAGGLHGVGVSVVCALSKWMRAEVCRNNYVYTQEYSRGKATTKVKKEGQCRGSGTNIIFEPDPEIFPEIEFSWGKILNHLRQQAYLTKKAKITIIDQREEESKKVIRTHTFYFEGGVISYIRHLNKNKKVIHPNIFYTEREKENIFVEVALQYSEDIENLEISFANNIHTGEGGMHLTGFRSALTRVLNDYARKNTLLKENEQNLSGDDAREGLTAIVSVKLKEPQFEGQTKAKLGNSEMKGFVESTVNTKLAEFLGENPAIGRTIVNKCMEASRARAAAKKARDLTRKKSLLDSSSLPGKLADCSINDPKYIELFLVEGDSAGGSAKQARDRRFQAILPLKGKILNVEKARLHKILSSEEIQAMVSAMGSGSGEDYDIKNARYHKVIIMTDADVDGAHIRTLILTFLYRYMHELIEAGFVYIAQPPLYQVKKDKEVAYAYSEKELENLKKKYEDKKITVQQYKGLGEMDPEQLWETTMNPEARTLLKVEIEDALTADDVFSTLMGKKVEPRRVFIEKNAKEVSFIDIWSGV